jgi:hypothetical protein
VQTLKKKNCLFILLPFSCFPSVGSANIRRLFLFSYSPAIIYSSHSEGFGFSASFFGQPALSPNFTPSISYLSIHGLLKKSGPISAAGLFSSLYYLF